MRVGIDIDGYRDEYTRLKAVFNFLHMFGIYNTIFEINRVSDGIHLYSYLGNIRDYNYGYGCFIARALCSDDRNRVLIQMLRYEKLAKKNKVNTINYYHVDVLFKAKIPFLNIKKKKDKYDNYTAVTYENFMRYMLNSVKDRLLVTAKLYRGLVKRLPYR